MLDNFLLITGIDADSSRMPRQILLPGDLEE